MIKKTVISGNISNEKNISQLKKQLTKEKKSLQASKSTKGKYLLVIENKNKLKEFDKIDVNESNKSIKTKSKAKISNNTTSKSMMITDGKEDVLGGKMICSKQSILYRMARSQLIACINKYKSRHYSYWLENYTLMNLEELSLIKHGKISSKCNKQNVGAYIDRTSLKDCLQQSLNKGRYIYRNPSSVLIKIKFEEDK